MDENGSYPVASFGIEDVGHSGSATRELVN
jgi:hypothetical protein